MGLAWGGVNTKYWVQDHLTKYREFIGLIPSVTLGYEFNHNSSFLSFIELTLSQPALSVKKTGSMQPIAELSAGLGF